MIIDDEQRLTRTTRHLLSARYRDPPAAGGTSKASTILGRQTGSRLSWKVTHKMVYDQGEFADRLHYESPLTERIADASLFDVTTSPALWNSLLSRAKGITIVPAVRQELEPWLRSHREHPAAQAVLLRDIAVDTRIHDTTSPEETIAFSYYVWLLGIRKKVLGMSVSRFKEQYARDPTPAELLALKEDVHEDYGPRGYLLARKGLEAAGSQNFFTDEKLVYTAVASALRSGNPVHILTKDEDVQEQFYKLIWLFDTHYRGMLLAEAYAADAARFRSFPMPMDGRGFKDAFKGEGNLLIERSAELTEVLPVAFTPVEIRCSVLGKYLTEMTFTAEREMAGLLAVKGRTRGLNTDLLGGMNCQASLAPMDIADRFRSCAAVAWERRHHLPESRAELSILDANQALYCGERFRRLVD